MLSSWHQESPGVADCGLDRCQSGYAIVCQAADRPHGTRSSQGVSVCTGANKVLTSNGRRPQTACRLDEVAKVGRPDIRPIQASRSFFPVGVARKGRWHPDRRADPVACGRLNGCQVSIIASRCRCDTSFSIGTRRIVPRSFRARRTSRAGVEGATARLLPVRVFARTPCKAGCGWHPGP